VSPRCSQKLARLSAIVAERVAWEKQLAQIKRMRQWVLDAEHLLSGRWAQAGDVVSNATVGERLDAWRQKLAKQATDGPLSELEQACLTEFLQVFANLRSHLVQCYDRQDFPRTNNELERSIRGLKMQSPRKFPQELEQLFVTLRALRRLCDLVGARCDSSTATGAACCPARPYSLASGSTGGHLCVE